MSNRRKRHEIIQMDSFSEEIDGIEKEDRQELEKSDKDNMEEGSDIGGDEEDTVDQLESLSSDNEGEMEELEDLDDTEKHESTHLGLERTEDFQYFQEMEREIHEEMESEILYEMSSEGNNSSFNWEESVDDSEGSIEVEISSDSEDYNHEDSEVISIEKDELEDYKLICYANFVLSEGISEKSMKRMESLMLVLYEKPPPITYYQVKLKLKQMQKKVVKSVKYMCHGCGLEKSAKRDACTSCNLSGINLSDTITFVTCDYKYQLEKLLKHSGHEILDAHRRIHNNENNFHAHDIRRYPGYRRQMESFEEFNRNQVNLICTLSSDGARFKRMAKREATPMLMRMEGVDMETRTGGKCMILISMSYSEGGVKRANVDAFLSTSLEDLRNLQIPIVIGNIEYRFVFKLMSYIADMKEQFTITGLPNWYREEGCSKCTTIGQKQPNGKISYNDSYTSLLRDEDSLRWAAENGTEGFPRAGIPAFYEMFSPLQMSIDPFHLRGPGVCKYIIEEITKSKRWNCRLPTAVLDSVLESIQGIVPYTFDTVRLGNARKLGKATGREVDKLCLHLCSIIGWNGCFENNDYNVLLVGMYHCLQFLGSRLANSGSLRLLLDNTLELLVHIDSKNVTMKWHNFMKHLQDHEEEFGVLHTTESFEREHKNFMSSLHHQTTNSELCLISRYVGGQLYRIKMRETISVMTESFQRRMEATMKFRENVNFDRNEPWNHIKLDDLDVKHLIMLRNQLNLTDFTCLKRISIETMMGTFHFSSKDYWRVTKSTSSVLSFFDPSNGSVAFGEVEIIIVVSESTFIIVRQFALESQSVFHILESRNMSESARKVLNSCREFPTTFSKFTGSFLSIVPLTSILCPATIVNFNGNSYVKMHR